MAALIVTISFVITTWAALTLALRKKSTTDRTLYIVFSVVLPAQLAIFLLLRGSFHAGYLSALLFILSVLFLVPGGLLLLILVIVPSFAFRRERPFAIITATCLSAVVFTALCFGIVR